MAKHFDSKRRLTGVLVTLATVLLASCGGDSSPGGGGDVELPAAETFTWGTQPISISAPPDGWERDQWVGGLHGVRFIKTGSVGEEISFTEHYALSERTGCQKLMELLSDIENLDRAQGLRRVQRARLYASEPINAREERYMEYANRELDYAMDAFRNDRIGEARRTVTSAFEQASQIRYSLDEVVDRVMFDPKSYDSFGRVVAHVPKEGTLAGEPSISVEYTLDSNERDITYYGKQLYVLKNNALFVLSFHGLQDNLPVFERVIETASFPPSQCVL